MRTAHVSNKICSDFLAALSKMYNTTQFFKNIGHKTFSTKSSDWVVVGGVLLSSPFNKLIEPDESELTDLICLSHALGARFPTSSNQFGFKSYLCLCDDPNYSLGSLTVKARNQVRQGLKNFLMRQLTLEEMTKWGRSIYLSTLERQSREDSKSSEQSWNRICEACFINRNVHVWGALDSAGVLCAYLIAIIEDSHIEIVMQSSATASLKLRPNNALTFYVTEYYLANKFTNTICYGLGSLEETHNLDRFKIAMGYKNVDIKQRLYLASRVRFFLRPWFPLVLEFLIKAFNIRNYYVVKSFAFTKKYYNQSFE